MKIGHVPAILLAAIVFAPGWAGHGPHQIRLATIGLLPVRDDSGTGAPP
jgi:hypothetical protein